MHLKNKIRELYYSLRYFHKDVVSLRNASKLDSFHVIDEKATICHPIHYLGYEKGLPIDTNPVSVSYYTLYDCEVVGGSQAVIQNGNLYHDLLSDNRINSNIFVSDPILLWFNERLVNFAGKYVVKSNTKRKEPIKKAISLLSHFSWNYYHFIYEVISKFYVIDKLDISDDCMFLLDTVVKDIPSMHRMLNLFIDDDRIVWVDKYEKVKICEAICVSCPHFIAPNFIDIVKCKYEDVIFCEDALRSIRDRVLEKCNPTNHLATPEHFYVSRKGNNHRQYNESEVLKVVKKRGIDVIKPQEYNFEEQVCLFNHAKTIIAASGAALSNILFCKKGCRIICMISDSYNLSIFSTIAAFVGAEMVYIIGKPDKRNFVQTGFWVDPDMVDEAIGKYMD